MQTNKNISLIKFKEVENGRDRIPYFIYPARNYNLHFRPALGIKLWYEKSELEPIDKFNKKVLFEYLRYNEDLKHYLDRAETFESPLWEKKYYKLKSFYDIVCDFLLRVVSDLYYKYLYYHKYGNKQFETLFGDQSRAADFSFDKAFTYAIELERVIRNHFKEMLNKEFPPIDPVEMVSGKSKKKK